MGESAINIVITVNSLEKGGRTKRIVEEYLGLIEHGHQVRLLAFSEPPKWVIEHYPCSSDWVILTRGTVKFDVLLLLRLLKFMYQINADLVHSHCESSSFYSGLACFLLRIPAVGTIHRSELRFYNPNWRNRLFYYFLDQCIAVSEERKERLVSQLGLDRSKIYVIHWGIDPAVIPETWDKNLLRDELNLPHQPILLSLGHLGPIKGHEDSIRALALLKSRYPEVKLYIGGDGLSRDYERLHLLIRQLQLEGSVILLGQITNPLHWLMACDIFLQPSREEAFGLVFLEAGLCGKPTVATKVGGIPEIVRDGKTGFLVATHSPEKIAEKLDSLLKSKSLSEQVGVAARSRVLNEFSLEGQVSKLEQFLRSVVSQSNLNS